MTHRLLLVIASLSAIAANVHAVQENVTDHPCVVSSLELLDVCLQAEVDYHQQPGIAVGIVYDQQLIYAKGFGFANIAKRIPITADTIFRIGSQSKQFTAIGIMQLHDEGKLSVYNPVAKYLTDLELSGNESAGQSITIEQLLTHTAGLPSEGVSTLHWTELDFPTQEQVAGQMKSLKFAFAPSTRRKYSNLGYTLAGWIIEKVSQQAFTGYVKDEILCPLEMYATTLEFSKIDSDLLATGYGRRMPDGTREVIEPWDARGMTPAFGMCSTLNDLAKFVAWQIRVAHDASPDILVPSTFRSMIRPHWVDSDWSNGWGLGFHISVLDGRQLHGHYGQVPGYFSSTYVDAQQKLGVIVLANSMDAQPYLGQPRSIQNLVFQLIGSAIERAKKGESIDIEDGNWTRLYGRYRNLWDDVYVFNYQGNLVMVNPSASNPLKAMFTLQPLDSAGKRFRIVEGPDPQLLHEEVNFNFGTDVQRASEFVIVGMGRSRRIE